MNRWQNWCSVHDCKWTIGGLVGPVGPVGCFTIHGWGTGRYICFFCLTEDHAVPVVKTRRKRWILHWITLTEIICSHIYIYVYLYNYIYSTHVFYIYIYMFWILQYRCTRFTYIDIACEYLVTWVSNNFPASMALTKPMSISWQEMAGDGGSICRLVDMFHVLNSCHIHSPWCHGLFLKRFQI